MSVRESEAPPWEQGRSVASEPDLPRPRAGYAPPPRYAANRPWWPFALVLALVAAVAAAVVIGLTRPEPRADSAVATPAPTLAPVGTDPLGPVTAGPGAITVGRRLAGRDVQLRLPRGWAAQELERGLLLTAPEGAVVRIVALPDAGDRTAATLARNGIRRLDPGAEPALVETTVAARPAVLARTAGAAVLAVTDGGEPFAIAGQGAAVDAISTVFTRA